MSYQLLILRRAQRELALLPIREYERIKEAIGKLADEPRPPGCRKLTGREGWRLRAGDYRVIYEVNDRERTVLVLHIGHRRDVYQ